MSLVPTHDRLLASIRGARRDVVERLFRADAELDASGVARLFHGGGVFQLGADPELVGPAAIERYLGGFFGSGAVRSIAHELLEVYDLDDALIYRALARYALPDGTVRAVPYMNRVTFEDGRFRDYRVHVDRTALLP